MAIIGLQKGSGEKDESQGKVTKKKSLGILEIEIEWKP